MAIEYQKIKISAPEEGDKTQHDLPTISTIKAAQDYIKSGLQPIPCHSKEKIPKINDWNNFQCAVEDVEHHFTDSDNIGLKLGQQNGGLVDIDLDCNEAVQLAPYFLPKTEMVSGHHTRPRSHWWYQVEEGIAYTKLDDPDPAGNIRSTIVEIRSDKHYTIVPPSIHPSGSQYVWHNRNSPAKVSASELERSVKILAAAVLLCRQWLEGNRNDLVLPLAGTLFHSGWIENDVKAFITRIADVAGDIEIESRLKAIEGTLGRINEQKPTTGIPRLKEFLGEKTFNKVIEWLGLKPRNVKDTKKEETTIVNQLLGFTQEWELFYTADKTPYATIQVNGHQETWSLESKEIAALLQKSLYEAMRKVAKTFDLQDALRTLEAKALFDGKEEKVFVRIAKANEKIYVDLCNEEWSVVEVSSSGWCVIPKSPVKFRRAEGMTALAMPVTGCSLDDLKNFVNLNDEDRTILVGWLVAALTPDIPYPILTISGEMGSAKSTLTRIIKHLTDPNVAVLRNLPGTERELAISASNSHALSFDNLSGITRQMSDSLCRLATGGGLATRRLYTNSGEVIFDVRKPVILNGIEDIVWREDLIDRCVRIHTKAIASKDRKPETIFWQEFEKSRPGIFGALLSLVSKSLRDAPSLKLTKLPRLADFTRIATAALGQEFYKAYSQNRESSVGLAIDSSPVASAIVKFMEGKDEWKGTATQLHQILDRDLELSRSKEWTLRASQLSKKLVRAAPSLRSIGIEIDIKKSGVRQIHIKKVTESVDGTDTTPDSPVRSNPLKEQGLDRTDTSDGFILNFDFGDSLVDIENTEEDEKDNNNYPSIPSIPSKTIGINDLDWTLTPPAPVQRPVQHPVRMDSIDASAWLDWTEEELHLVGLST
jgi:hypothetical protein